MPSRVSVRYSARRGTDLSSTPSAVDRAEFGLTIDGLSRLDGDARAFDVGPEDRPERSVVAWIDVFDGSRRVGGSAAHLSLVLPVAAAETVAAQLERLAAAIREQAGSAEPS